MNDYLLLAGDYTQDVRQRYSSYCELPGFVLLESSDTERGRYDILSAHPYDRMIIPNGTQALDTLLTEFKQKLPLVDSHCHLPFQGGAIGFASYDLGARQKGIESKQHGLLSTMPLLDFGFYDWALIVDHHLRKVTWFAANRHPETVAIVELMMSLWGAYKKDNKGFKITRPFSPLVSKKEYEHCFNEIQESLRTGRSYQVNLTQAFQAGFEGDPWSMYQKINAVNPVPYAAYFHYEDSDVLSFSPEQFLFHEHGIISTSPIKGTIGRSSVPEEDECLKKQLLASAKNRAENVMIVDLLRHDLSQISKPGSVTVTGIFELETFNGVHHLVSHIQGETFPERHPVDLFLSCFPGGSITGAPKLEAMRIIAEQEYFGRGVYCGSIGYFSAHGRFETSIAIRTLIAKDKTLHLAAGGGLVIDSDSEDEYGECYTKINAIINGLN